MEIRKKRKWWKSITWHVYQFSMITVCCITVALIYANNNLIKVKLDGETTILMATIGFLFAFAGINIYSIFNTNIEEEKGRLRDLQARYEKEMMFERTQGLYSRKLLMYYQTCQMITDSQSFNPQIYEWIFDLQHYVSECKKYMVTLFRERGELSYTSFKSDFCYISRGIKIQLISFRERIQSPTSAFFSRVTPSDKRNFLDVLNDELIQVESLEDYDYIGGNVTKRDSEEKEDISVRLRNVWVSIKKLLCLSILGWFPTALSYNFQ